MPTDCNRPGDGGDTHCHYHPQRPALVRCGRCSKYLCPECVYHGPVGTRCAECLYGIEVKPVSRARRIGAGAAGLLAALIAGSALGYTHLLSWLTAIALGLAVGHVTRTVARRITVPSVQAAAGVAGAVGVYVGALVGQMRLLAEVGAPLSLARAAAQVRLEDWAVAGALATGIAIYWVWRG